MLFFTHIYYKDSKFLLLNYFQELFIKNKINPHEIVLRSNLDTTSFLEVVKPPTQFDVVKKSEYIKDY